MLVDGRSEFLTLAALCETASLPTANGWRVDFWLMEESDLDAAVAVYDSVLAGGTTDDVVDILTSVGMDLTALLEDAAHHRDEITRSDLCEFISAASLISDPSCDIDSIQMPNVPKMSRRKSESGLDIVEIQLNLEGEGDLAEGERMVIASVKHTVHKTSSADLRRTLANSLSVDALTPAYLATQFRVFRARLIQEGMPESVATRIYLFLRDFPDPAKVQLFAIGLIDPDLEDDLASQIERLPAVLDSNMTFRRILVPNLREAHERCS